MQLRSGHVLSTWPTVKEAQPFAYPFETVSQMRNQLFVCLTKCDTDEKDFRNISTNQQYQNRLFILICSETLLENKHLSWDPAFKSIFTKVLFKLCEVKHLSKYRAKLIKVLSVPENNLLFSN